MEKYYYIVQHSINDKGDEIECGIYETYEEAVKAIEDIADWWEEKGSGTIVKRDHKYHGIERWCFRNNCCYQHYDW